MNPGYLCIYKTNILSYNHLDIALIICLYTVQCSVYIVQGTLYIVHGTITNTPLKSIRAMRLFEKLWLI